MLPIRRSMWVKLVLTSALARPMMETQGRLSAGPIRSGTISLCQFVPLFGCNLLLFGTVCCRSVRVASYSRAAPYYNLRFGA